MTIKLKSLNNGLGSEMIASGIVTGEEIIEALKEIYNEKNLIN